MDTQNLKAFVAVADNNSFSLAADLLHVTQPAISKRIHLLEEQLSTQLFDRIGRQVSLTEAGRALLPHARAILVTMDSARQAIADLSGEVKGQLKLITSHHVGLHRLPGILRDFSGRYPLVEVDLQFMDSAEAYAAILKGESDLGIITEVEHPDDDVHAESIWTDHMMFVVAPEHPLAEVHPLTLAEISPYQALLPESRFFTTKLVEQIFQRHDLPLRTKLATNYLETIKALVSAGYAWSVLPESMLRDGTLKVLEVVDDQGDRIRLSRHLDCIYHRRRLMSNAGRAFLQMLTQRAD